MSRRLTGMQKSTVADWRASGLRPEDFVRTIQPPVSAATLRLWGRRYDAGQDDPPDGRARPSIIDSDPEMGDHALGLIVDHPSMSSAKLHRKLVNTFGEQRVPSQSAVQRWRNCIEQDLKVLLAYHRDPNEARHRYQAAVGSRSEDVHRPHQRWEMDGNLADLKCDDGRRYVLSALVDVYTRQFRAVVTRSASAVGVAALLRRCIAEWGVPEQVVIDRGSDYISKHVEAALSRLTVDRKVLLPARPEEKPHVERSFGTLTGDLLEGLPGYVGRSVAERQQIRERKRAKRRLTQPLHQVEVRLTPQELQAEIDVWATDAYGQRAHGGLGGRSPQAVADASLHPRTVVPERALDVLLAAPASGNGHRRVGPRGVQVERACYAAPELAEWIGQTVEVRLDGSDAGVVWCFNPRTGAFLGRAVDPTREGVSRAELAVRVRERQRRFVREGTRELRAAAARAHTRDTVAAEIKGGAGARPPSDGTPPGGGLGTGADVHGARVIPFPDRLETPEVAAALAAAGAGDPAGPVSLSDEDLELSAGFDEVARGFRQRSKTNPWED